MPQHLLHHSTGILDDVLSHYHIQMLKELEKRNNTLKFDQDIVKGSFGGT